MDGVKPDAEMLANLDLLLNMDLAEAEPEWETVADLDEAEKASEGEEDKDETP